MSVVMLTVLLGIVIIFNCGLSLGCGTRGLRRSVRLAKTVMLTSLFIRQS